jgi:hypothetical protein
MSYEKFARLCWSSETSVKTLQCATDYICRGSYFLLPISETKTTKINKLEIVSAKDFSVSNYYFIEIYLGVLRPVTTFLKAHQ